MLAAGARPPSSVDFSDVFKQTSKLVQWSPDGKLVAAAVGTRLAIRVPDASTRTMEIIHLHLCKETIEYIEWSCDGQYVLCGMYAKGLVQIWAIDDPDWTCRINEGIAGLVSARWAPDGRHILTTSDFSLHLTVWSLLDRTTTYIKNPKPHRGSVAFSKDGEWMAAADRVDCKDYIGSEFIYVQRMTGFFVRAMLIMFFVSLMTKFSTNLIHNIDILCKFITSQPARLCGAGRCRRSTSSRSRSRLTASRCSPATLLFSTSR